MNEIKNYENLRNALDDVLDEDKDYVLIRHTFPAGEAVGEHFHPNVNEYLLFDSGSFEVTVDFEKKMIDALPGVSVIHFPKGYIHGLRCLSDMSYYVLRDGKDEIIYLDDVLKRKEILEPHKDPCGMLWELYNDENLSVSYDEVTGTARKHKHLRMDEKYKAAKGEGQVVIGDAVLDIREGGVVSIPKNAWHYLKKVGEKDFDVLVITHPKYDPSDMIFEDQ